MCEYTYALAPAHCNELLVFMDEQRKAKDENLCDIRFIVGDSCVYAHRSVLAVCSAYFQGLLSGAFSESQGEGGTSSRMMEIDFTGSVSNIAHLDTLLSAAYTGSLKLSPENITGVTELACFLLVERVRVVCESFLLETLAMHTCLHYLKLAYRYDLTHLFKATRQMLQSRFHDHFIHQPEMMTITASCLRLLPKIYKYVHLRDVIQFLVHWVEGGEDGREVSNTREERISAACSILTTHSRGLELECLSNISESSLSGSSEVIGQLLGQCAQCWKHLLAESSCSGCCILKKSDSLESCREDKGAVAKFSPNQGSSRAELQSRNTCSSGCSCQTDCSSRQKVHPTHSSPDGEAAGCSPDSEEVAVSCHKDEVASSHNTEKNVSSCDQDKNASSCDQDKIIGRCDQDESVGSKNQGENIHGLKRDQNVWSHHKLVHSSFHEPVSGSHDTDKSGSSSHEPVSSTRDIDKSGSSSREPVSGSHDIDKPGGSSHELVSGRHDTDKSGSSSPDRNEPNTIHDLLSGSTSHQVSEGPCCLSHDGRSSSGSPQESSRKRELGGSHHLNLKNTKRQKTAEPGSSGSDPKTDACDVLVAFAPGKKAVRYFTATDCTKDRPRYCALEFEVCVYNMQQKQWLWAGRAVFPDKFEDRDAWRVACVNSKAYFLSLPRQVLHVLDLKTLLWSQLDCRPLYRKMSLRSKVRSLVPIAVGNRLHVLASDKQPQDDGSETFLTLQRYFRLEENGQWQPVADVHHAHMATPLTVLSVSEEKVFVVKATITLNLEKSMLIIQEGHVFDSARGEVTKFGGTTYAASPMRVLVRDGCVHLVDGDSQHRQLLVDSQSWEAKEKVNLSDIKIGRAASGESYLPCLTHSSSTMGSSTWEFCAFLEHRSALTELRLGQDSSVFTVRHPPPPFRYLTIMTACQLSAELVSALTPCHYLHADSKVN